MDIILFDYYNLKYNDDVNFYWMDKNRTFVLQTKDYLKEENNAVHPLKAHLDGEYSLEFKPKLKQIKFGVRVKDQILFEEKSNKVYFKISNSPELKITKLDKKYFQDKEYKIKTGVGKSARLLWNLYWYNLHYLSYNYPENPSDDDKNEISKLTSKMKKDGLACPRCRGHFIQWVKANPIENSYDSREKLILWYFNLHNDVNSRNKKTLFKREQSDKLYTTFRYDDMIKDYKVDVMKLFKSRQLETLPDLINNQVKRRLWKQHDVFEEFWLTDE